MTAEWVRNAARDRAWACRAVPTTAVRDFHRSLPGYAATRLVPLPALARSLGVSRVYAKDESNRLGLPAFKALGASWAIHRALRERALTGPDGPVTVATATDGNHGRAVARFARQLGHRAAVFVPDGVHPAAVQAIRDEGADVTHVPGDYDAAVRAAASADALLLQDMAWDGYEQVPGWIVEGYSTLFAELDEQLDARPDLLVVPAGVGSLLQAALTHYRAAPALGGTADAFGDTAAASGDTAAAFGGPAGPLGGTAGALGGTAGALGGTAGALGGTAGAFGGTAVVSVEPSSAACVLASVAAGHPVTVTTGVTSMAGLNCGTVSSLAWPLISHGLDAAVAVPEAAAAAAVAELAAHGVDAGPCGAATLAALHAANHDPELRATLALTPASTVVLLITEGTAANPLV